MTPARLFFVAVVGLTACAPRSPKERADVSRELAGRTGHDLRATGATDARLPPGVALADGLTEDEAVAAALWNNPTFQADLASLTLARADLIAAGMIRNPLLTLLLPLGPKQLEFTALLPLEALWQRPRRVAAAQGEVERVATALVQNGLDLVRDTKRAHAVVVAADARLRLARQSLELRSRIAEIARGRLAAGDISRLEESAVRLDVQRAREDVLRLEADAAAARDRLLVVLGLPGGEPVTIPATPPEPRALPAAEAAVKQALALRPDVRAAELAIEAWGQRQGWERSKTFPLLAAVADANGAGKKGFELGPGLVIELPLFDRNQAGRLRADAELERAAWGYLAVRQRVALEVREALRAYGHAQSAIGRLRADVLAEVAENVARAERAYAAGEVPHLTVLEVMGQELDARLTEVELDVQLRSAGAELDRSLGRKTTNAR